MVFRLPFRLPFRIPFPTAFGGRYSDSIPEIIKNSVAYFDANVGVEVNGSDEVVSWTDRVGGFVAEPRNLTGFNKPTYNGTYIETTDSGNRILDVPGDFSFLHNGNGGTVYIVADIKGNTGDGFRPIFATAQGDVNEAAGVILLVDDAGEQENLSVKMGNGTSVNYYDSVSKAGDYTAIPDVDTVYTYRHATGDNVDLTTDEDNHGTLTPTNNTYGGISSGLTIGGTQQGGLTADIKFKAILLFNERHTDPQAEEVREYLNKTYRKEEFHNGYIKTQSVIQPTDDAQAAMTAVGDVTRDGMHRFLFLDGTHDVVSLENNSYQVLQGQSRSSTFIDMLQPDTTSSTDISVRSTLELKKPCVVRRLTTRAENGRYPWHAEVNSSLPSVRILGEDCTVEHLGNPSGNNTWAQRSQVAVGSGTRSNSYIKLKDCLLKAPERVVSTHNNIDLTAPSTYEIDGCTLTPTGVTPSQGIAIGVETVVGSGLQEPDKLIMRNCITEGGLEATYNNTGYNLTPDESKNTTDYTFDIIGTDIWWVGNDSSSSVRFRQEGLRLASVDATDSDEVKVSGDTSLLTSSVTRDVTSVPLGGGLVSYVEGTLDVNDFYNGDNSLGSRLGDKTGSSTTLTLTQGGKVETVTFDKDYSAMTNVEVLGEINGQLTKFVATTTVPMNNFYPSIPDNMVTVSNVGSVSIGPGYGVRLSGSDTNLEVATSTDEDDVGIAVDPIGVGQEGRTLRLTKVSHFNLYKDFTALPTDGDKIGIGTTDGQFTYDPPSYISLVADGTKSYTILDNLEEPVSDLSGVVAETVFELDATVDDSYSGTGQTWSNIIASPADGSTQTAYDFALGSDTSPSTDDPGFDIDKFTFDGGDYFTISGSNTPFINSLHRSTTGNQWFMVFAFKLPLVETSYFFSNFRTNNGEGIYGRALSNGRFDMNQAGGGDHSFNVGTAGEIAPNTETLFIFTYDKDTNTLNKYINGVKVSESWSFVDTTADATYKFKLCIIHPDDSPFENGAELYGVSMGNKFLSDTEASDILDYYRNKHGRSYGKSDNVVNGTDNVINGTDNVTV